MKAGLGVNPSLSMQLKAMCVLRSYLLSRGEYWRKPSAELCAESLLQVRCQAGPPTWLSGLLWAFAQFTWGEVLIGFDLGQSRFQLSYRPSTVWFCVNDSWYFNAQSQTEPVGIGSIMGREWDSSHLLQSFQSSPFTGGASNPRSHLHLCPISLEFSFLAFFFFF